MIIGDSLAEMRLLPEKSVNAVITSPPFALTREKSYGNEPEDTYVDWFMDFAREFKRLLVDDGSLVLDLGGAWLPGRPVRSLYQYKLLLRLHEELGFKLAEDFYWFNTAKIPGPREWVTARRIRAKDAVNLVWWLSLDDFPKADNRRVLTPYSPSMERLIARKSYNRGVRTSGHAPGEAWAKDHGGAIPPNVIAGEPEIDNFLAIANTASGDAYLKYCREHAIPAHPARFPAALPEFFVRFITLPGDLVLDPFAGSNMTGAVAEANARRWLSVELDPEFVRGSVGRLVDGVGFERTGLPAEVPEPL
jgi:site-specific DNA-methyltransferase (cytosine-N4-specific)